MSNYDSDAAKAKTRNGLKPNYNFQIFILLLKQEAMHRENKICANP